MTHNIVAILWLFSLMAGGLSALPQPESEPQTVAEPEPESNAEPEPESNAEPNGEPATYNRPSKLELANFDGSPIQGDVQGQNVMKQITYRADGNYKMSIKFESTIQILFADDFQVGKCNKYSPGVAFIGLNSETTILQVDLNLCQIECDFESGKLLASIDILNQPLDIKFSLMNPDFPTDKSKILCKYHVRPSPLYREDYILEMNTQTYDCRQLVIDDTGDFYQIGDNIQFNFMTFQDSKFTIKSPASTYFKKSAAPGHTTFLEICPVNGFTPAKMITLPEICFLKDLTNENTVMMWDMSLDDQCLTGLEYKTATGIWHMNLNYYEIMKAKFPGYETPGHNNFKLTCSIRLCGNVVGNPCQHKIDECQYAQV